MNATIESFNNVGARFTGFALPMLLQSAALIALLFALDFVLRKRARATIRYALWMLALVKLALPPSLALPTGAAYWLPADSAGRYTAIAQMRASAPDPTMASLAKTPARTTSNPALLTNANPVLTWQTDIFVAWLVVATGLGLWALWRLRRVAGLVRQSAEAPAVARELLDSCRRQLGIRGSVQLRCADIGSPAIGGVWRPVIIIPHGLAEKLNAEELRLVLLHELAHYKRGDLWVNLAQIIGQIFYWYNPLLWLANASIRRAREQAVDEMVLVEMGAEAQAYPAALLRVARLGLERPLAALGLLGILEPGHGLTQRILHIVNRPLPRTAQIGARGLAAALLLGLVALPMACRRDTAPPHIVTINSTSGHHTDWSAYQLRTPGAVRPPGSLSPAEVAALEAKLAQDPEDFAARRDLLLQNPFRNSAAHSKHVLWVIEHHPEFPANDPEMRIESNLDPSAYQQGKTLWLQNVTNNPSNPAILANAAAYFTISDNATAIALLTKAQALDPRNPALSDKLGQVYRLELYTHPDTDLAKKALAAFERAQADTSPVVAGAPRLVELAQMAVAAGELDKARTYATEILGPGMKWGGGSNAGRAQFYGNLVLGQVALREGKLDEASKFLVEAGKTKGYATLDTFGPNMALAKELLEKGETNSVLEFFQECEKFWPNYGGVNLTAKWTAEVKAGKTPDFGANLNY